MLYGGDIGSTSVKRRMEFTSKISVKGHS